MRWRPRQRKMRHISMDTYKTRELVFKQESNEWMDLGSWTHVGKYPLHCFFFFLLSRLTWRSYGRVFIRKLILLPMYTISLNQKRTERACLSDVQLLKIIISMWSSSSVQMQSARPLTLEQLLTFCTWLVVYLMHSIQCKKYYDM